MEDSKREKATEEAIVGLKSLIHGHRVDSNSPDRLKISGSLADRITETLIYGKERKSESDLKIDKVKKALIDFAKQAKRKPRKRVTI